MKSRFLMKYSFILVVCLLLNLTSNGQKSEINNILDNWHQAAADADLEKYFDFIDEDGYYLGTDQSEIWTKEQFLGFCKPYFEKKNTWDFKAVSRNVYLSEDRKMAWFEEVLDTWMGACRGSGVLIFNGEIWKLKQYNLAILVDNDDIKSYLQLIENKKEK